MNYDLSNWILGFLTFIWTIATPLFVVGGGAYLDFRQVHGHDAPVGKWVKSKAIVNRSSCFWMTVVTISGEPLPQRRLFLSSRGFCFCPYC